MRRKHRTHRIRDPHKTLMLRRELKTILILIAALSAQAYAIVALYRPAGIVSSGVTGISMLLEYATADRIPSWATILVLNIPLMILALKYLHLRFTLYSIFATVYFSVAVAVFELLKIPPLFDMSEPITPLLSAIFAAVILGTFGALIIRQGASSGGMDIVSLLLNRRYSFPMGTISMSINVVICIGMSFVNGIEATALSVVALFISSMAFNSMLQGANRTKTLFIISDKWDEFAPQVLMQVRRGVTYIPCRGAYTNKEKTLVYIIAKTVELAAIRRVVLEHDEHAIISIIDTREVVGKGFSAVN